MQKIVKMRPKITFNKTFFNLVLTLIFLPDILFKKCQSLNKIEQLFIKYHFQPNFDTFLHKTLIENIICFTISVVPDYGAIVRDSLFAHF